MIPTAIKFDSGGRTYSLVRAYLHEGQNTLHRCEKCEDISANHFQGEH